MIYGDGGYRRTTHEVPCARTTSIEIRRLERPSEFGHFGPVEAASMMVKPCAVASFEISIEVPGRIG